MTSKQGLQYGRCQGGYSFKKGSPPSLFRTAYLPLYFLTLMLLTPAMGFGEVNIFADVTTYNSEDSSVELSGNVEVFDHRFSIKGDRAKVVIGKRGIIGSARGNITYSDRSGNIGIADAMDIDDQSGKYIKLIGNVTIWHNAAYVVSGDVIYHYYEENRTVIESSNGSVATLKSSDGLQSLRRVGGGIGGKK